MAGAASYIQPRRRKIDKDKARGIIGLAAQMHRVVERGNECITRLMRLGGHVIAPSREPIERWSARGRRSYKTLRAALINPAPFNGACDLSLLVRHKFLPREQFTLEFYYRLKFYASARDLNFAATICARLHSSRLKFTRRLNLSCESKTLPLDR